MAKPDDKPYWAVDDLNNGPAGGANVVTPPDDVQARGWNYSEKPPREYFNWLARYTSLWIDYFEDTTDDHETRVADLESTTADHESRIDTLESTTTDHESRIDTLEGASLPAASESVAGVAELATAAETQAFSDDARIVTPLKLAQGLQGSNQSLASSGYQKLPGGMIMQWGVRSMTVSDIDTFSFPITFPTACLNVSATIGADWHSDSGNVFAAYASIVSASQIKLVFDDYDGRSDTVDVFWFAIGH